MVPEHKIGDQNSTDAIDAIAAGWLRERPGTPVASIGIVTRLWNAAKIFGDDRNRLLRDAGADTATLDLLSTLRRSGPPYRLSTRDLASASMITKGAITQRVDRAVHEGLVTRTDRGDGTRRVDIALTDTGHRRVEELVDSVLLRESELLRGLTESERVQLEYLLRRLLQEVRAAVGEETQKPRHVGG